MAALVDRLTDDNGDVRRAAAEALQGTTDSDAVAALVDRLTDEDSSIVSTAHNALRRSLAVDAARTGALRCLVAGLCSELEAEAS